VEEQVLVNQVEFLVRNVFNVYVKDVNAKFESSLSRAYGTLLISGIAATHPRAHAIAKAVNSMLKSCN
jgi:hypothetical protein